MKIAIEATNEMVTVDGRQTRRWKGVTERGVECDVFVARLRVMQSDDCSQFEDELKEMPQPELPPIDLRFLV